MHVLPYGRFMPLHECHFHLMMYIVQHLRIELIRTAYKACKIDNKFQS